MGRLWHCWTWSVHRIAVRDSDGEIVSEDTYKQCVLLFNYFSSTTDSQIFYSCHTGLRETDLCLAEAFLPAGGVIGVRCPLQFALFLWVFPLVGGAQTTVAASTAALAGKVVSETGRTLRAVVVLQPLFRGAVRTVSTSLTGNYQFGQVTPGKYLRQIKGIYKVKNPTLQDLHGRAKELIAQLDWFSIGHALREHNTDADRLANEAMDKGMGRVSTDHVARVPSPAIAAGKGRAGVGDPPKHLSVNPDLSQREFEGVVRNGVVELVNGKFPDGTQVQVRAKK